MLGRDSSDLGGTRRSQKSAGIDVTQLDVSTVVRFRPLLRGEPRAADADLDVRPEDRSVCVAVERVPTMLRFSSVLPETASQARVYEETCYGMAHELLEGRSAVVVVAGAPQTGHPPAPRRDPRAPPSPGAACPLLTLPPRPQASGTR